jgi:hypothetical protein
MLMSEGHVIAVMCAPLEGYGRMQAPLELLLGPVLVMVMVSAYFLWNVLCW